MFVFICQIKIIYFHKYVFVIKYFSVEWLVGFIVALAGKVQDVGSKNKLIVDGADTQFLVRETWSHLAPHT